MSMKSRARVMAGCLSVFAACSSVNPPVADTDSGAADAAGATDAVLHDVSDTGATGGDTPDAGGQDRGRSSSDYAAIATGSTSLVYRRAKYFQKPSNRWLS